jgi:D-xylose reductase
MDSPVDQGQTTTIGVSNFLTQLLRQILSYCRIRTATMQKELHAQKSQQHLIRFDREVGMKVTAFSVLARHPMRS